MSRKKIINKRATTDNHRAIGMKIRAARLQANMSQADLGKSVGISFQQIQKYEKGRNRVDIDRMRQIAEVLNVNMSDFLEPMPTKKKDVRMTAFQSVLSTRHGTQVLEAMIDLSEQQRQLLVDIARGIKAAT